MDGNEKEVSKNNDITEIPVTNNIMSLAEGVSLETSIDKRKHSGSDNEQTDLSLQGMKQRRVDPDQNNKEYAESEDRSTNGSEEDDVENLMEMLNTSREPAAQGVQNGITAVENSNERNIDPQDSVILMELLGNAMQENLIRDRDTIRTLLKNSPFGRKYSGRPVFM